MTFSISLVHSVIKNFQIYLPSLAFIPPQHNSAIDQHLFPTDNQVMTIDIDPTEPTETTNPIVNVMDKTDFSDVKGCSSVFALFFLRPLVKRAVPWSRDGNSPSS